MQFYYGDKMPLRILDEGEFWKMQEAEHTVVIRELVPDLEPEFVNELREWEQAFSQTHAMFVRYIETVIRSGHYPNPAIFQEIMNLVHFSLRQSRKFVSFLNRLAEESNAIKGNQTAIVVLNHIRRESEYFIGISKALIAG